MKTKPIIIHEGNQGTIAMCANLIAHARTKHINIRYHYVRKAQINGHIAMEYCLSDMITADILTKPLPRSRYEKLRSAEGIAR